MGPRMHSCCPCAVFHNQPLASRWQVFLAHLVSSILSHTQANLGVSNPPPQLKWLLYVFVYLCTCICLYDTWEYLHSYTQAILWCF